MLGYGVDGVTKEDVWKQIDEIRAQDNEHADDDEYAHILEDQLYLAVLGAIAGGAANARELAEEALKTQALNFARWCA